MRFRDWPTVLGLAVFALVAVACAGYMVAIGADQLYAVAGAILVLAVGQIISILVPLWRLSRLEGRQEHIDETLAAHAATHDDFETRLETLQQRVDHPPPGRIDEVTAELRALRDGIRSMMQRPEPEPREVPRAPAYEAVQPEPAKAPANEHLDLLLEPVIELSTGATSHYRAQLNLADDHGHVVPHRELMDKADRGGMRAALDVHLLKQVAPVLRRLRVKQPALRIFVPLGALTLAGRADLARMTAILRHEDDVASGLVFEIAQETLGTLGATGIESLAELGRLGATMALSNVVVSGLDLASLRQLGVRFLAIGAAAFDGGFGMSPSWRDFAQYSRAMQFQIMASGIATAQQATAATQIARFGCGPFFAPPRKVRGDAGEAAHGLQRRPQAA